MNTASRDPDSIGEARHLAAVTRSMEWADESACRGDLVDAPACYVLSSRWATCFPKPMSASVMVGGYRSVRIGQKARLVMAHDLAAVGRAPSSLNCPRCGLSIERKVHWLAIEHCPRRMARARVPVKLFCSALPSAQLYGEGSAPRAGRIDVTTTNRTSSSSAATM